MAEQYEVARFSTLPEAELLVALLARQGIKAWLPDRDMAYFFPHLHIAIGGVRVVALAAQIDAARDVARRARAGEFATPDDFDDWKEDAVPGKVGELAEGEIHGAMSSAKKIGAGLLLISAVSSLLVGCPTDLRLWLP